jgi:probable rRNA maturation factor
MQIHIDNRTDIPINASMLNTIASTLTSRDIEVIFTDNAAIRELNARHRGKNKPTDVLSFPLEGDLPYVPLGSIVISVEYAKEKARAFAHTLDDEIALLFIHGLLHLLGYDHETDNGEMRKKEREIIEAFELPQSLIVRTEGE